MTVKGSARLWRQLVAMIYDGLLIIALFFIAGFGLLAIFGPGAEIGERTIPVLLYQVVMEAVVVIFYTTFWVKNGQTLGMQAWKIKLTSIDGSAVDMKQTGIRLVAAWLSLLPAGLGYWWALIDKDGCTWHDRLSETRVYPASMPATGVAATGSNPPSSKKRSAQSPLPRARIQK